MDYQGKFGHRLMLHRLESQSLVILLQFTWNSTKMNTSLTLRRMPLYQYSGFKRLMMFIAYGNMVMTPYPFFLLT